MTQTNRRLAAAAIAVVGLIHLVEAPEYFEKQAYIGVLFLLGGIGCLLVTATLWRRHEPPAWLLGSLIALGMAIGFILSRTVGLPGFKEEEWELSGLICLVLEAAFLGAAALALSEGGRRRAAVR